MTDADNQLDREIGDEKTMLCQLLSPWSVPPSWTPSTDLKHFKGVKLDKEGKVKLVDLNGNQLKGIINLAKLPGGLQELNLRYNQLTGTIDLTQLPDGLKNLRLSGNQLSGNINLTKLPQGMHVPAPLQTQPASYLKPFFLSHTALN